MAIVFSKLRKWCVPAGCIAVVLFHLWPLAGTFRIGSDLSHFGFGDRIMACFETGHKISDGVDIHSGINSVCDAQHALEYRNMVLGILKCYILLRVTIHENLTDRCPRLMCFHRLWQSCSTGCASPSNPACITSQTIAGPFQLGQWNGRADNVSRALQTLPPLSPLDPTLWYLAGGNRVV